MVLTKVTKLNRQNQGKTRKGITDRSRPSRSRGGFPVRTALDDERALSCQSSPKANTSSLQKASTYCALPVERQANRVQRRRRQAQSGGVCFRGKGGCGAARPRPPTLSRPRSPGPRPRSTGPAGRPEAGSGPAALGTCTAPRRSSRELPVSTSIRTSSLRGPRMRLPIEVGLQ